MRYINPRLHLMRMITEAHGLIHILEVCVPSACNSGRLSSRAISSLLSRKSFRTFPASSSARRKRIYVVMRNLVNVNDGIRFSTLLRKSKHNWFDDTTQLNSLEVPVYHRCSKSAIDIYVSVGKCQL